jgi:hypothetical protein
MPKLLPPTVGERLAQCGTQVEVWGIVPGADVTLEADGASQTVRVNATSHLFTVASLPADAKVRARQSVAPDETDFGNVVTAEKVSLPPGPPATESTLPGCGQCIFAWGVDPGSKVEILQGGVVDAEGIANGAGHVCMSVKHPPPTSYVTQTTTCGTVSPVKGNISVNPAPSEVPPPKIVEPVFECQSVVGFEQLLPGAIYEIFVTDRSGTESSVGTFCACTANMPEVNIPHAFRPGDRVKAIGSMENDRWQCHVRGRMSPEVEAVPPDDRIKPVIDDPVWEADQVILVRNQIGGGTITLMRKTNAQATGEENLGSRPSSTRHPPEVPPGTTLQAGNIIWVDQELCGVVRSSDRVTVQGRPSDIKVVKVRKPVFACAEIVIVDEVIPGAMVWVRQIVKPPAAPGPEVLLGKKKSEGSTVVVTVYPLPREGHEVLAYQEISEKFSPP